MSTIQLFKKNLSLSLLAAIVGAFLGLIFSYVIGLAAYSDVLAYKFPSTSGFRAIGTAKLEAFERMQAVAICVGLAAGFVAAQSVFLVRFLRVPPDGNQRPED